MPSEVQTAFFSYCREDSGFALKLAEDMKAAGAQVWIDQLDIEPGTPWDRSVEEALNNAPRMLVLLSPVSVNSDNVRDEVSFALSQKKRVIPVLYRDCDIPFRLARLQYIDFRPEYERGLKILLRALGVGEAGAHASSAPVAAATADTTLSREEQASAEFHVKELERERAEATERERKAQEARDAERRAAAEPARANEERPAAALKPKLEQERERPDTDAQARQEQTRREQRLAEQARLQEEARQAAEKARLAQQEQARKEAEIKARQEQLRREEQESVERKSFDLEHFEQQRKKQVEAEAKAAIEEALRDEEPALAQAGIKQITPAEAAGKAAPALQQQSREGVSGSLAGASKLYVWGAAALVVLIGLTFFLMSGRKEPVPPGETNLAESKSSDNALSPSSSAANAPTSAAVPAATPASDAAKDTSSAAPANAAATEASKTARPVVKDTPAQAKTPVNVSKMGPSSSAGLNRVQLPADVSKNFLVHEVAPPYPPLARQARVHGVVTLKVIIDKNGAVESIKTVSGHPLLVPGAIDAVKQWHYRPFVVDDKPVEVDTLVTVKFELTN